MNDRSNRFRFPKNQCYCYQEHDNKDFQEKQSTISKRLFDRLYKSVLTIHLLYNSFRFVSFLELGNAKRQVGFGLLFRTHKLFVQPARVPCTWLPCHEYCTHVHGFPRHIAQWRYTPTQTFEGKNGNIHVFHASLRVYPPPLRSIFWQMIAIVKSSTGVLASPLPSPPPSPPSPRCIFRTRATAVRKQGPLRKFYSLSRSTKFTQSISYVVWFRF